MTSEIISCSVIKKKFIDIVLRKKVAAGMRDRRRAKFTSCVGLFAWRVASGRHIGNLYLSWPKLLNTF